MGSEKRLYRSRDALIGGVCAGVAAYFSVDPLVVRILTIALTLATGGLLAVAYAALWVVLPREPVSYYPVDVEPRSVQSDTYGHVDYSPVSGAGAMAQGAPHSSAEAARAASRAYAGHVDVADGEGLGVAHVPPEPPAGVPPAVVGPPPHPPFGGTQTSGFPVGDGAPAAGPTVDPSRSAAWPGPQPTTWSVPQPVPQPTWTASQPMSQQAGSSAPSGSGDKATTVQALVTLGFVLLGIGLSLVLGRFVDGVSWWQFWPLIIVIVGLGQMVVPGEPGKRTRRFTAGAMNFCLGVTLLVMALDILQFTTLYFMVAHMWPLLVVMGGLYLIGRATKSPVWILAAGACFIAFCVMGLLWFAVPGATEFVSTTLPFGKVYVFDINPWR